jgi:hypothetical protein
MNARYPDIVFGIYWGERAHHPQKTMLRSAIQRTFVKAYPRGCTDLSNEGKSEEAGRIAPIEARRTIAFNPSPGALFSFK